MPDGATPAFEPVRVTVDCRPVPHLLPVGPGRLIMLGFVVAFAVGVPHHPSDRDTELLPALAAANDNT